MRKESTTIQKCNSRLTALGLNSDAAFHRSKLILKIYRDVVWVLSERAEELQETAWIMGEQDIESGLCYLENFAPDIELQAFEEKVCCLVQNQMLVNIIDRALLRLKRYPDRGELYYEILTKGLCGKPLLIVRARQAAAVSLIPIEQGKPYRLFLVRRKGVPCVGRCLCQSVTCFQGDTGLDTERRFPVHIHTVLVISRAARSITVNDSTGIVPHGVPVAVIGVGKGNRTNISCCKRCCRRHYGQCRDRRQRKGSGFLE